MKKTVPSSSKLKPANFVRRVLSRTTTNQNHSKTSLETDASEKLMEHSDKSSVNFESELTLLRKQIENLQITVNSMHNDTEKKERALATLAREKEQLAMDLKRQKRSNVNLKQQLDDERKFYYKEKEQYCNEMNNFKKLKQKNERCGSKESIAKDDKIDICNTEITQLKDALNQTLEANYNLSVKFLRMKNTKLSLSQQLSKLQQMHDKAMLDYRKKLQEIQKELDDLVNEQFAKPISPSNKQYLQIIKQNGRLIHENLCLQLEIDRLNLELEKMKMSELRNDTNSKLKYIHNTNKGTKQCPKCKVAKSKKTGESDSTRTIATTTTDTNRKTVSTNTKDKESLSSQQSKKHVTETKFDSTTKYDLMNVSNSNLSQTNNSDIYYSSAKGSQAYRTQSAPEIVQSTLS